MDFVINKIMRNIDIKEESDCLLWTGKVHQNPLGYAKMSIDGRLMYVHRYMHEQNTGPIPKGMTIDHECNNCRCINPLHLRVMSYRDNVLRSDITIIAKRRNQTHCKRGHELSGDNLASYGKKINDRVCRVCKNERQKQYKARRRNKCRGI